MNTYLARAVVSAVIMLASYDVRATPIDILAGAPGVRLPSNPSATVLTFDGLPLGSLPSYQFGGGALSGWGAIENTGLVGKYAQPAGDVTNYLSVSYPFAAGAVQFVFSDPENYFGLYWGSMDGYNSITFLRDHGQIATDSGVEIAGLTGLVANGDQQSPLSNRYINFYTGAVFYDEIILGTTDFGFEVDNIAFGDPPVSGPLDDAPAPIPEPSTLMVPGSSLYGLAFVRRRRAG